MTLFRRGSSARPPTRGRLARGGSGSVFKARDRRLGRPLTLTFEDGETLPRDPKRPSPTAWIASSMLIAWTGSADRSEDCCELPRREELRRDHKYARSYHACALEWLRRRRLLDLERRQVA